MTHVTDSFPNEYRYYIIARSRLKGVVDHAHLWHCSQRYTNVVHMRRNDRIRTTALSNWPSPKFWVNRRNSPYVCGCFSYSRFLHDNGILCKLWTLSPFRHSSHSPERISMNDPFFLVKLSGFPPTVPPPNRFFFTYATKLIDIFSKSWHLITKMLQKCCMKLYRFWIILCASMSVNCEDAGASVESTDCSHSVKGFYANSSWYNFDGNVCVLYIV